MAGPREIWLSPLGQYLSGAQVRKIVYPVARRIGARVVAVHEPGVTPNFFAVTLDESLHPGDVRRLYLLYSRDYDAWAVVLPRDPRAEPEDGCFHLHAPIFFDHEGLAAAMTELHGIALWPSHDLSMPVPFDFPQRALNDVAHWQPERVGDALFNWWD